MANPRAISTNPPPVHLEASGVLSLSLSFCSWLCLILSFSLSVSLWLIQALSALTTLSLSFLYPYLSYFVFVFSLLLIPGLSTPTPWPSIWRLQVFCQTVPLVMYCKHLHLNPLSKKINETLLRWMLFNLSVQESRSPSTAGEICIIPPIESRFVSFREISYNDTRQSSKYQEKKETF